MSGLCDDAKKGRRCGDDCCSIGNTLCGWDGQRDDREADIPLETEDEDAA